MKRRSFDRGALPSNRASTRFFQLREQLRQSTELAGAHLENQRTVNTAEHHMLQQGTSLAKAEFQNAVATEQGRFEERQAQARTEVQNEVVGQAQSDLLRREASLSDRYTNAETMLDAKMKAMESRMAQEQSQAIADINRQAEAWKERVTKEVSDGQTSGLRQQLAEAQKVTQRLEATENSMAKNKARPSACSAKSEPGPRS